MTGGSVTPRVEDVEHFEAPRNPFPGLRPFDVDEADLFFGRDTENYEILQRLAITHFLAVIGNSGCGKSSLVKAGVIAALQDGHMAGGGRWRVASFRPGNQPVRNLSAALSGALGRDAAQTEEVLRKGSLGILELAGSGGLRAEDKLLILADQFEELFQYVGRENTRQAQEEAKAFIKLLLSAASSHDIPVYVMLTMRSEYVGLCGGYVGLAEAINEGIYLVPQMTRQQYQDTITEPIRDAGCTIPDFLVDRILNDLTTQTDQLPLLQHALMRMWLNKGTRTSMELKDYTGVGEIANCLNGHADSVYNALTPRQKEIAEKLFRTITELTPDNRKVRNPCSVKTICENANASVAEVSAVASILSTRDTCFLFIPQEAVTPSALIDLSHEALIRKWTLLDSWVMDEGRITGLCRALEDSTRRWRDYDGGNEEKRAFLYRGAQLRELEELLKVRGNRFSKDQLDFIRKSQAARRAEQVRHFVLWVVMTLLVAGLVGFAYLDQRKEALNEAKNARILQQNNEKLQSLQEKLDAALQQTNLDRRHTGAAALARLQISRVMPLPDELRNGLTIQYFAKQAELESNKDLIPAWRRLGFKVDQKGAQYELPSNKIWYGTKVDLQSVQTVAYTLLENGIALRLIEPLSKSNLDQGRERVIQVGWSNQASNLPLLTPEDIKKFQLVRDDASGKASDPKAQTSYAK